jgi:undecaprenol kinase/diacylglycerol kinase (ATP)
MKKQLLSFKYAFNGFKIAIREEHNFRIHLIAIVLVIAASYYFKISTTEWLVILLSIGMVITGELINTAIENLADIISPEYNTQIKKAKDTAAAAVLFASIISIIVALLIFIPKI